MISNVISLGNCLRNATAMPLNQSLHSRHTQRAFHSSALLTAKLFRGHHRPSPRSG
jgi:hypothetical protein